MRYLLYVIAIVCIAGCGVKTLKHADDQKAIDQPPPPSAAKIQEVGEGFGDLVIDGNLLTTPGNSLIKIKGGVYNNINISNITGEHGVVTITNNGLVRMTGDGQMRLKNLSNVVITGNGTDGISKGFLFEDMKYRSIEVDGVLNNFTLQYMSFKNIGDNVFTYHYNQDYDGSEGSYSKNLKFLHNDCDNTGQFISGAGSVDGANIKGYIKNIEIAHLDFKNSPDVGTIVWLGNVEGYDIHNNTINNINTKNNNHNGIFLLNGNGKFHNNKISNHQGNAIRAFGFTVGNEPKNVLIYNNIVFNSRKYSAFEVQSFATNIIPKRTTHINALIFNNTCGNLNLSNDWQGNVADVYNLIGGTCKVFNNLAFNLPGPHVIAGQESVLKPVAYNNLYFKTSKEAGIVDEQEFKLTPDSPARKGGVADSLAVKDFYNHPRGVPPSIGAVE